MFDFEDDDETLRRIYREYYGIEEDLTGIPSEDSGFLEDDGFYYPDEDPYEVLTYMGFTYNAEDDLFYDQDGFFYHGDDLLAILGYTGYDYGYSYEPIKLESIGTTAPKHSILRPVDIKAQKGPKCSAYSSSCLLRYKGYKSKPKALYKTFAKLPDGSALPSSVGKKIGAKMCTKGTIEDIEKIVDSDTPALVLCYYGKDHSWDDLHYILVTGYDDEKFYIADSLHASGEKFYNRVVTKEEFKRMWDTSDTFLIRLLYGKNIYYAFEG